MKRDTLERLVITAWALLFLVGLPIMVALVILRLVLSSAS